MQDLPETLLTHFRVPVLLIVTKSLHSLLRICDADFLNRAFNTILTSPTSLRSCRPQGITVVYLNPSEFN